MGRPLNDRNFGDAGIAVRIDGHTTAPFAVIIKQVGSKRFMCAENEADKANATECKLVKSNSPGANEMSIVLKPGVWATKISGRKLTGSDGNTYTWDILSGIDDGDTVVDGTGNFDLTDE